MLRVQLHNGLKNPLDVPATRVVVLDQFGNPVIAVLERSDRVTTYSMLGQPDFQHVLHELGILKTVVATELKERPLSDLIWTP